MKRFLAVAMLGCAVVAGASAAPLTKQNGSSPASTSFKSICAVPGFVGYGLCNGDATQFTGIKGRVDAVQPKRGVWNLDVTFTNVTPGASYRLWGNQGGTPPVIGNIGDFFAIATAVADASGTVRFSYQTTKPANLGFDLNTMDTNITLVTSYWSIQWLELNPDGTLYALSG
jgi:hypothetical protein